jgi:hypothetical protein
VSKGGAYAKKTLLESRALLEFNRFPRLNGLIMQEKAASLAQGRPYKQKSLRRIVSRTTSKPPSPPLVCAACRRRLAKQRAINLKRLRI